jgi:YkoY family integral membrane protein
MEAATILVILNIIILEIILSIDNAAVLATMVQGLPESQRKKALTYGIFGAYLFRGLALLFATIIINITWLKVVGGAYLLWLSIKHFVSQSEESKTIASKKSFWLTVLSVEIMDLVFSIDNVLASVAFSKSLIVIGIGVAVGILAIRFTTGVFMKVIHQNPVIEKIAFVVIGALGIKLILSYFWPVLSGEAVDLAFSAGTLLAFIIPVLWRNSKKN